MTDPAAREKFNRAWALAGQDGAALDQSLFGEEPGLTVIELVNLAGEGKVRGLYILGENPLMTDPDSNHVREMYAEG